MGVHLTEEQKEDRRRWLLGLPAIPRAKPNPKTVEPTRGSKTWGYVRASTAGQIASPATQKGIISKYCLDKGIDFDQRDFFVDPATSGKTNVAERPAGRKMMSCLRRGDAVVVAHLDRMCRSIINFAVVLQEFEDRGVVLHIVDFPGGVISPDNHMGRLLCGILALFADYERRLISARIKEGFAAMKAEGHHAGVIPYGKTKRKKYSRRLKKTITVLEPNEEEMKVLRLVLELRIKGYSFHGIADHLNAAKIPTRMGKTWNHWVIQRCLQNGYHMLSETEGNKATAEARRSLRTPWACHHSPPMKTTRPLWTTISLRG